MEMTGEQRIAAPRQVVWAALNDPDILRRSIDGCESIERDGDDGFIAKVVARIGPVKASFSGRITFTDVDAPHGYTLIGEGTGVGAGFAQGIAQVQLGDEGDVTRLSYRVQAEVGGKLAQIGSRLIDSTARKQADTFFARFASIVQDGPTTPRTADTMAPRVVRAGPGWAATVIMILMALMIGFLASKIWGCPR